MNSTVQTELSACPSCHLPMRRLELPRHDSGMITLDICFPCQGIWFDSFESVQISPGGIINLFKLIHAHRDDPRRQQSTTPHCPRCRDTLIAVRDIVRSGRFTYRRCPQDHGRFTAFAQFMIEKGFVRQLVPAEIKALAARIGTVHCSGCGAPVDIRTEAACSHCNSPISILDPAAVEKALAAYHDKEYIHTLRDPEALADAVLSIEKQRSQQTVPETGTVVGDLFLSGLGIVGDLFA